MTPANCDLRDFAFMPLDVERLRRSKAWLKAKRRKELAFYVINLWMSSWHEVPAASLEADDDVLADRAMCDPDTWDELKNDILHGWVLCTDGRLYHPVVAEKAVEAWQKKEKYRERSRKGNAARWPHPKGPEPALDHEDEPGSGEGGPKECTATGQGGCTGGPEGSIKDPAKESLKDPPAVLEPPKGQGQGQGQGEGKKKTSPAARVVTKLALSADDMVVDNPDLPLEAAEEYLAYRKAKKAPLTAGAWKSIVAEVRKTNRPLPNALAYAMNRGWTGFELAWLRQDNPAGGATKVGRAQSFHDDLDRMEAALNGETHEQQPPSHPDAIDVDARVVG